MLIATKTLSAIEAALTLDQGAKFRGLLKDLMPLAGDAYDTKNEEFRTHLGASLIGRNCDRKLWYSFRWATSKQFDGRMLRLFNRGHLEEPRMVALLKMIGCEVWQHTTDGKQFRITGHRGHFGGSLDAVVEGIPDLPANEVCLAEFKTHGEKSFTKLIEAGVTAAKWEHFVQQQMYMAYYDLKWSLYMAVNKNTDALHAELVQFDPIIYGKYAKRAIFVIEAITPPKRINESPSWFGCKFCDHKEVCHKPGVPPARNCRTCLHSRVGDKGEWFCVEPWLSEFDNAPLSPDWQRKGCDRYEMNTAFKACS